MCIRVRNSRGRGHRTGDDHQGQRSQQSGPVHGWEVNGSLVAEHSKLTIGPHGNATASASAGEVDIHGTVTGNVECTGKTIIRASGRLTGDVRTAGIVIENGAGFKGRVEIVSPPKP